MQSILNNDLLQLEMLGNTVGEYFLAALIFLLVIIVLKIFQKFLIDRIKRIAQKTKTDIDDIVVNVISNIHWPFYVLMSFYIAIKFLNVHNFIAQWSYYLLLIAVVYYIVRGLQEFVDYGTKLVIDKRRKEEDDEMHLGIITVLNTIVKILLWVAAILIVLSNLGYNVNSLIAGLGIGGIAVAFALQNILSDIFSSFSIYFDRPFRVGDFIVVGNYKGTVKRIGIKTTRIQSLQGEEIVIPNNELTQTKLQNFGVMEKRRVVFTIGITYETPLEKVKQVPQIIREAIEKEKITEVERIHFKTLGDFALIFEAVFYINSKEYKDYMDIQQSINLFLMERFAQEGIEFAYPTQTLYLKKTQN